MASPSRCPVVLDGEHGPRRARCGSYSIRRAVATKWLPKWRRHADAPRARKCGVPIATAAARAGAAGALTTTLAVAVTLALAATVTLAACQHLPEVIFHTAAGRTVAVAAEVAATPTPRNLGLMYRRELPAGHGMVFLFPESADHSFWMKNTPLPLDIIFIDEARTVVGIQADTVPYSERRLSAGRPSRYVLEVPAGFCAREGISVGDRVEFRGVNPDAGS